MAGMVSAGAAQDGLQPATFGNTSMQHAKSGPALAGGRSRARLLQVGASRREQPGVCHRVLGRWKDANASNGWRRWCWLFTLPLGALVVSAIAIVSHTQFALPLRGRTSDSDSPDRPAGDGQAAG